MKNGIQRGDLFYADLTPVIGSEQGGVRPVVIIQNDAGNRHSPTVIAAAITSRTEKKQLPTHIRLPEDCKGLHRDSTVLLEQVRTIDRTRLREYIGKLNADTMQCVDRAIAVSFGLDGILGMQDDCVSLPAVGQPMERRAGNQCRHEQRLEKVKTAEGEEIAVEAEIAAEIRKRAWIYCAIDAPEDTHGVLKEQFKQLVDYGEQMGFELVGSSSDIGAKPLWKRRGFQNFVCAAKSGKANILLITSRNSLSRSVMQIAQFQILIEKYGLGVYCPLEGRIYFDHD